MNGEDTTGIYLLHFDGSADPRTLHLQNVQTGRVQRFESLDSFVRFLAALEPLRRTPAAKAVPSCE